MNFRLWPDNVSEETRLHEYREPQKMSTNRGALTARCQSASACGTLEEERAATFEPGSLLQPYIKRIHMHTARMHTHKCICTYTHMYMYMYILTRMHACTGSLSHSFISFMSVISLIHVIHFVHVIHPVYVIHFLEVVRPLHSLTFPYIPLHSITVPYIPLQLHHIPLQYIPSHYIP